MNGQTMLINEVPLKVGPEIKVVNKSDYFQIGVRLTYSGLGYSQAQSEESLRILACRHLLLSLSLP